MSSMAWNQPREGRRQKAKGKASSKTLCGESVSPPRFASLSLSFLFLIALWWQDGCHRAGRRIHVRVRKVGKGSIVSLLCLFFIRNQSLSQNYPRSPQQTSLIFHWPEIELMFIFRSNTDKKGRGQHDWSKSKEPFSFVGRSDRSFPSRGAVAAGVLLGRQSKVSARETEAVV